MPYSLQLLEQSVASSHKPVRPKPKNLPTINNLSVPTLTQTTVIDLDITDGCNLACSYCFKNLDHPNNMSLETAKAGVEWLLLASGNVSEIGVNFMGGEPSLRFSMIKELVPWARRRARSKGKRIGWSFTSNMTAWTDELRSWVDEVGCGVLMSIDGCPEVQDAQRPSKDGKPKSEIIAKWAKSMLRTRPLADARMTLSPKWAHRLFDSVRYLWEDVGFTSVVLGDADYNNWNSDLIEVYRQQLSQITDYLFHDFCAGGSKRLLIIDYYLKHLIHPRAEHELVTQRRSPCGAGHNYCMIDYVGDIWPCHRFDGAAEDSNTCDCMKLGNIYEPGFNERLSNAFRSFDHQTIYKPVCKTCPVEPICGGFCPAANLQDSKKSIYTPHDGYCNLKWTMYEVAKSFYDRMAHHDHARLMSRVQSINAFATGEV